MSESYPEVQITESTVNVLNALTVGDSIDLETDGEFTHGVGSVHSETAVFSGRQDSGEMHVNSLIVVRSPAICLDDISYFRQELSYTGLHPIDSTAFDATNLTCFYQHIPGFETHVLGLALPISSNGWHVKTTGPGFWKYKHEERRQWTENILSFHTSALNAILRATERTHWQGVDGETEDYGRRVVYLMPGIANDQENDSSIDEEPDWNEGKLSPEHYFGQFVGIGSVVRDLCDVVYIADTREEERQRAGVELDQAVLLVGPTGVGKTELAKRFAEALGAVEVMEVCFSDVSDPHIGEWGRKLDDVFTSAYEKGQNDRVVIFMDELDGLVSTGNLGATQSVTTVLKKQLEAIRNHPNVFFIAATNEPDLIDPVIRADKRMTKITVSNLSESGRQELLRKLIFPEPSGIESSTAPAVAETLIEAGDLEAELSVAETRGFELLSAVPELSCQLADFSPGDIREVIAQVRRNLFLEAKRAGLEPREPSRQDFLAAIDKAKKNRT